MKTLDELRGMDLNKRKKFFLKFYCGEVRLKPEDMLQLVKETILARFEPSNKEILLHLYSIGGHVAVKLAEKALETRNKKEMLALKNLTEEIANILSIKANDARIFKCYNAWEKTSILIIAEEIRGYLKHIITCPCCSCVFSTAN